MAYWAFRTKRPRKKLKLTRRDAFAVFGAGALALGLPAALAAEPAREGRSVVGLGPSWRTTMIASSCYDWPSA
jgi:hypothetical protein